MRSLFARCLALVLPALWCCADDGPTGPGDPPIFGNLRYEGSTTVDAQDHVLVSVSVRNVGQEPERLLTQEGCNPIPRLFRSARRSGRPVWDGLSLLVDNVCMGVAIDTDMQVGEERTFTWFLIPAEVRGDSLDSGRYFVQALFVTGQVTLPLAAGTVDL